MADYIFNNPMIEYVDAAGDVWLWNQIGTNPWASQSMPSNPVVTNEIAITALVTFPFDWYLSAWFNALSDPVPGDYTSLQLCALYDQYTSYLLGGGGTGTTLSVIAVSPSSPKALVVGDTLQFSATGTYSDGTIGDITSQVTWSSSNPGIAVISTGGLATAIAAGSTAITAALSPINSTPVTLAVTSTPGAAPAASGNYWESLLPMPPQNGPPLPSFLSFGWPWLKTPATPGNLQITVYDASTQQLLKGAAVTLTKGATFLDDVFQRLVAPTNASGFCSFIVPLGTYSVQCAKVGYITTGLNLTVTASGGSATINLVPNS